MDFSRKCQLDMPFHFRWFQGGDRAALLPANTASTGFGSLERVLADNAADKSGGRKDWQEVEGCWVLGPPPGTGPPQAVAMFCGGAFAGAAPQLTYRLLIECLTNRNLLVSTWSMHALGSMQPCNC